MAKKVVFELEDQNGNTFVAFELDVEKLQKANDDGTNIEKAIVQIRNGVVADVDEDYLFESEAPLVRIQPKAK